MNIFEYIKKDNQYKYFSNKFSKTNGYFNEVDKKGTAGYNLFLNTFTELQTRISAEYKLDNFDKFNVTKNSQLARVEFTYRKTSKEFQINIYDDTYHKDGTSEWYDFMTFVLSLLVNPDSEGIDIKYLFKDYKNKVDNEHGNYYFTVKDIDLSTDQFKEIVNYIIYRSYMKMSKINFNSAWKYVS